MICKRGLSLVETVVAFTLLALVVAFVLALFPSAISANQRAANEQTAFGLAQDVLEEAAGQSFVSLVCPSSRSVPGPAGKEGFDIQLEVFEVSGEAVADVKGLRCLVRWTDRRPHQVQAEAYVTRIPR